MRVLVVDDEADIRLILRLNLEQWGHEVTEAASAQEALAACRRERPDALLVDLSLPDHDGGWLLDTLGRGEWPAEVAVLSAALPHHVTPLTDQGARYLAKPFGIADLRTLIDAMTPDATTPDATTPDATTPDG